MAPDGPERILYTVWPVDDGGLPLPECSRLIGAADGQAAAREYVELYADLVDWSEPFTLLVRRVSDPNKQTRRFRIRVAVVPVGDSVSVREEVGRG